MPDTIYEINIDSLSLHQQEAFVTQRPDSFRVGLSSFEQVLDQITVSPAHAQTSSEELLQGFSGEPISFFQSVQSVFFFLFAVCFVVLAFWFNKEGPTLVANFRNIFSGGARNRNIFKEQITTTAFWSEIFLVFQTVLIADMAIFTYFWDRGISALTVENMIFLFLLFFLVILLFLLVKYLLYKLIDGVFLEWGGSVWTEKYFRVVELSGLLIFFPTLFCIFVPEYSEIAFFLLTVIFFIIMLVVFWNLLNIFAENKIGLLNYFLYLCAIEIVPFLLIYKAAIFLVNLQAIKIL